MTQDAKKDQDDPKLKDGKDAAASGDDGDLKVDPKIAEIMKDPDAISALLETKRAANAEAKRYREKLEQIEKAKSAQEESTLKEQGKYKELAEKADAKVAKLQEAFSIRAIQTALKLEAMKEGIVDIDGIKLVDTAKIKIDEDFNVEGAAEAIAELKKAKPYLFEKVEGDPPPPSDGTPRPSIRDRVVKPDDEKISGESRLSRYFENARAKIKK